jgi:tetratricopeptide (TPR) repeat protein
MTFAAKNAGSSLGEKALINAFTAARDQNDVAQMTKIGEQLLRDYPKSAELVSVLGSLGKLAADQSLFDETTRYLSEAARREIQSARGQETLRTAAVLRAQRGDRKGAEDDLHTLKEAGAPAALLADVALALADLYRHTGDLSALGEVVRSQPQAAPELRMDAINAALLTGATPDRFVAELRALSAGTGDAAADARLILADLSRQQLDAITFTAKRNEDAKVIARRFATQNQVEALYLAVVKSGHAREAVAALSRLRLLYKGGADFLASAPVPAGLPAGDAEKYQAAFRAKAQPLLKKADEALRTCAETAQKLHVFSAIARACVAGQEPPLYEPFPQAVAARPAQPDAPALRTRLLKNPNDGEALVQLASLHYKAGDLYGAKLVVDRAIEAGGASLSNAQTLAGVIAHDLGESAEAYRHLSDATRTDKKNQKARLGLAALYREAGYGKLVAAELPGVGEVPQNLQGDPLILVPAAAPPAAAPDGQPPQEKK